jgi:hypothetical protein
MIRNLESSRDNMLSLEKTNPSYAKKANYYNSDRYQEGIDWLKDNKDNFRIFQGATPNNYVIFHGRHLNITHWDGNNLRTLVPVDHDPFGGFSFAPGEEGRPLYLGQNLPLKQPTPTGDEALSYYIW